MSNAELIKLIERTKELILINEELLRASEIAIENARKVTDSVKNNKP